jgi:D-glycero-D-manno-heptose 1,7-bisphosphate phosphatase
MQTAIFLDRDGVLIENRADYVREWSQVQVYPGAIRALAVPALVNYRIVIITNQSAVGRGLMSLETAQAINDRLVDLIHRQGGHVDAVYMCPHRPAENCACRKPRPGLLLRAAQELSLDLGRSWMIGDAWSDIQAGQAAGIGQTILLKTGRGAAQLSQGHTDEISASLIFDDLPQAIESILHTDGLRPAFFRA